MAKIHVVNVVVLDNPSPFFNPFQLEITFECTEDLREDLEWKLIYVGSAESEDYDQVLDQVFVGPVPEGRHMFVFQADPPDPNKIPVQDAVGVTVIILSCSYRSKEFIRVGYYVNNEYSDAELRENPPTQPQFDKLQRNILATNPRVTKFKIDWCDVTSTEENDENEQPFNGNNGNTSSNSNGLSSFGSSALTSGNANSDAPLHNSARTGSQLDNLDNDSLKPLVVESDVNAMDIG
ncbi:histone chaperone ASF1-like [Brevipalpus obovatus]|uniref:histone chaperone ASF1-like n=1 Tax=Brevipalpus obovatus TaxID=246614 RepID=UPI003D9DC875